MQALNTIEHALLKRYLKRIEAQLVLDIDASVIESHKSTAFCTYKGMPGYTPMFGHIKRFFSDRRTGTQPLSSLFKNA